MSEEKKNEVLGQEKELSLDELDAVSGGEHCMCEFAGGGEGGGTDSPCGCFLGGAGDDDFKNKRCKCVFSGWGDDTNILPE